MFFFYRQRPLVFFHPDTISFEHSIRRQPYQNRLVGSIKNAFQYLTFAMSNEHIFKNFGSVGVRHCCLAKGIVLQNRQLDTPFTGKSTAERIPERSEEFDRSSFVLLRVNCRQSSPPTRFDVQNESGKTTNEHTYYLRLISL